MLDENARATFLADPATYSRGAPAPPVARQGVARGENARATFLADPTTPP
ncbi:hypothetical protein T484DRAFT_1821236 [Baffinella frigidus]|nr:hypothetical protein T484DRAFT_1821236 [Cryptophyta sp. CCMP2293]